VAPGLRCSRILSCATEFATDECDDKSAGYDPHLRGLGGDRAATWAVLDAYRVNGSKLEPGSDYVWDMTSFVYS
jgi:hypothetical protein